MSKFYSAGSNGFYDISVHGSDIPDDAVEISDDKHVELLNAQAAGKIITCSGDGRPVAIDMPEPSAVAAAHAMRMRRDAEIDSSDWLVTRHRDQVDAGIPPSLTAAQFKKLLAYRQALRDITVASGFPEVDLPVTPNII